MASADEAKQAASRAEVTATEPDPIFLSKTQWKSATLIAIDRINHDSRNYKFALEAPDQLLGLPTGQHVYARLRRKVGSSQREVVVPGELIQRAYTPVSPQDARGTLDMLIKVTPVPMPAQQFHR